MTKRVQIILGVIMLIIGGVMILSTANSNNAQSSAMATFIIGAVLAILGLVTTIHGIARKNKTVR